MNTRMIVPSLLSAIMLATPVMAAGYRHAAPNDEHGEKRAEMISTAQCASLEQQFDAAIKTHAKAPGAVEAKRLRADGGNLCASGQRVEGVAKLRKAITDLGVKAKS